MVDSQNEAIYEEESNVAPIQNAKTAQDETTESYRKRAKALITEFELTQNQAAKEIGVSGATLNLWLAGKYSADTAKCQQKIVRWIEFKTDKLKKTAFPAEPDWQPTPTGKKIQNVLSYSQIAGDIAVIYGSAGMGKSKTIEHYATLNPSVWVAVMNQTVKSSAPALMQVADAVGIKISGGASRIFKALVNAFKGTGGLLVIDEAQHLNVGSLEAIRALHDESKIGLALVGNEDVYGRLTGGKRSAEFAQLFSRVGKRLRLIKPHSEDILAIAKVFGIESKAECEFLKEIGQKPGGLRGLIKTLRLASLLAYDSKEKVCVTDLKEAWLDISGEE